MAVYRKMLLAVDLAEGTREVAKRAKQMQELHGASLSIVHVVEYIPVEPLGEAVLPAVNLEDDLVKQARRRLDEMVEALGASNCDHEVIVGNVKTEIVRRARELEVDLIVIGSHERHGLGVLVNFAEDTVLHAASCDVLAVRIRN